MRKILLASCLALFTATAANAQWQEAKSKHFIIYSDQSPAELKNYATRLERYDQAVRKARGMADPELTDATRLTVFVLRDRNAIESMYGAPGSGVAGFYIPHTSGPVAFVHRGRERDKWGLGPEPVFFHEYFHHLMLENLGSNALPAWMVEGYAEFFGTAELLEDGSVRFGAVPKHRANGLFNFDAWGENLTAQEIVGATYKELTGPEWESVYGKGWLLTHYLTFEPSRKGQTTRYVDCLQTGRKALDCGQMAFGDLKALDGEIQRYLNRKTVSAVTIPASQISVGGIAIRPLAEAEAAALPVVMQSSRGVNRKQAPGVAADARRVASRYPNDPLVLAALAEAELDSRNYAAAIAAADKAIAANPKLSKALIMRGKAMLEAARENPAGADWTTMRSFFVRANKLDPEDPEPMVMFYDTFRVSGQAPAKSAVDGLYYALEILPQSSDLRLLVVRQLAAENRLAEARKAYAPIAYDPHLTNKQRAEIAKVMNLMVAGNGRGAVAEIDRQDAEARAKARSVR